MTGREFLEQYKTKEILLSRIREEYKKERDQIDSIRSALSNNIIPSGYNSKTVELRALRLAEKAERLKAAEVEALATRQKVYDVIAKVEGVKGQILYERYINLKKWEDVAAAVCYDERHARRLHNQAIEIVEHVLKCPFYL